MTEHLRPSFALSGPSIELDGRTHAVRGDLADIALAGKLFVPHYAKPMEMRCIAAATLYAEADGASDALAVLDADARFMAVDMAGGWAWGFAADGHMVGYVSLDQLDQVK
ncbi:MAG: hypothetical protein RLZ59_1252 [Pseudomonadota bacterium]|jgi:hypothetical protein